MNDAKIDHTNVKLILFSGAGEATVCEFPFDWCDKGRLDLGADCEAKKSCLQTNYESYGY